MIDYTTLKHQADGTPTWDAFLGIILKVAVERQNWQSSELIQRTLEEVGREFEVTRERIRQIEAKALRKLRRPSRSKRLRDYMG